MLTEQIKYIVHDISVELHNNMPLWPGKRHEFLHSFAKSMDSGDEINLSRLEMSMHTGTHIDAPYHKIKDGRKLHEIKVGKFLGPAQVLDLGHVDEKIMVKDLKELTFQETDFYLFKTKNSNYWVNNNFKRDFIYFDKDAAEYIAKLGPIGIGIDYMSVDAFDARIPYAHNAFFSNEILVYEGLNLSHVKSGEYFFIGLPLNLKDSEGSVARAILIEST